MRYINDVNNNNNILVDVSFILDYTHVIWISKFTFTCTNVITVQNIRPSNICVSEADYIPSEYRLVHIIYAGFR